MKIYTEVNYKWLDGQLVKTDSKSFEYDGEVIFCSTGGGGGGGALTEAVTTVVDTGTGIVEDVGDVASDVGGAVGGGVGDVVEGVGDVVGDVADITLGQAGDILEEGITTGGEVLGEGLAMNEGVATTIADFGTNLNTNMAPIVAEADRWGDAATTNMQYFTDFLGEKAEEVSNFLHPRPDPTTPVNLEKIEGLKGDLKNKTAAELKANKAKKRARASLRIG